MVVETAELCRIHAECDRCKAPMTSGFIFENVWPLRRNASNEGREVVKLSNCCRLYIPRISLADGDGVALSLSILYIFFLKSKEPRWLRLRIFVRLG